MAHYNIFQLEYYIRLPFLGNGTFLKGAWFPGGDQSTVLIPILAGDELQRKVFARPAQKSAGARQLFFPGVGNL